MTQRDNRQSTMPPLLARFTDKYDSPADVTLPAYLCLAFLSGHVKKRFFGGDYVGLGDGFDVFGQICEVGALIASRSDGNVNELEELVSVEARNGDSLDWAVAKHILEEDLALYGKNFVKPPPSLRYFQNAIAWIKLDVGWPRDHRYIMKELDRKMGLPWPRIESMLKNAQLRFRQGILFALTYPDRYAEMDYIQDALRDRNDIPYDMSQQPSVAERNELQLAIVRDWARLCRPDLAYLLEESSTLARGSARGTSDITANLTTEDYERMGVPSRLAARLNELASSGLVTNPSLPWFLWLVYASEHLNLDGFGRDLADFGKIAAAFGAVCEIGGVVGQTTDVEPLKLLSLTVNPITIRQVLEEVGPTSPEEFWREIAQVSKETLESYLIDYGADPPGLLPFDVYHSYQSQYINYPNDLDATKRKHDVQVDIRDLLRESDQVPVAAANMAFTTGIALVRNHPETFAGKHGVYVDEAPDPTTNTYKNPQSETNLKVGSTYSREEQLNLCRVWAELYRSEAKALFKEAS